MSTAAASLEQISKALLESVGANDTASLEGLAWQLDTLRRKLQRHSHNDHQLSTPDRAATIASARKLLLLSTAFADTERDIEQSNRALVEDWNQIVASSQRLVPAARQTRNKSRHLHQSSHRSQPLPTSAETVLNVSVMRQWLFDHIDHPFPTHEEKQTLADESNRRGLGTKGKLKPSQCTLWFINARRRSGWTEWARRFARNEPPLTRALVAAIRGRPVFAENGEVDQLQPDSLEDLVEATEEEDKDLTPKELAKLCRRKFDAVIDWVEQGANQRVGDWMNELAKETKGISAKSSKGKASKAKKRGRSQTRSAASKRARTHRAAKVKQSSVRLNEDSDADEEEEESQDELQDSPSAGRDIKPLPASSPAAALSRSSSSSDYSAMSSLVSGGAGKARHVSGQSTTTSMTSYPAAAGVNATTSFATHKGHVQHDYWTPTGRPVSSGSSAGGLPAYAYAHPHAHAYTQQPTFSHPWVQQYLEQQRAENAAMMAAPPQPTPYHSHAASSSRRERSVKKLSARAAIDVASRSNSNVFVPPMTAAAAVGANWGLPSSAALLSAPSSQGSSSSGGSGGGYRSPGVIAVPDWGSWAPPRR